MKKNLIVTVFVLTLLLFAFLLTACSSSGSYSGSNYSNDYDLVHYFDEYMRQCNSDSWSKEGNSWVYNGGGATIAVISESDFDSAEKKVASMIAVGSMFSSEEYLYCISYDTSTKYQRVYSYFSKGKNEIKKFAATFSRYQIEQIRM